MLLVDPGVLLVQHSGRTRARAARRIARAGMLVCAVLAHGQTSGRALCILISARGTAQRAQQSRAAGPLPGAPGRRAAEPPVLLAAPRSCRSYFEWSINAAKLDALEGVDQAQRWSRETCLYDRNLLRWAPLPQLLHARAACAAAWWS